MTYPKKAVDRRLIRAKLRHDVMAEAERKAAQVGRSLKCGGAGWHANEPLGGGCQNDGSPASVSAMTRGRRPAMAPDLPRISDDMIEAYFDTEGMARIAGYHEQGLRGWPLQQYAVREGLKAALVASGWKREADVLRQALQLVAWEVVGFDADATRDDERLRFGEIRAALLRRAAEVGQSVVQEHSEDTDG
jgi:hypothetical protein